MAAAEVMASMRRVFAPTDWLDVILNRPICEVDDTWVPPHSSRLKSSISSTRTNSPYFSSKNASAPISAAYSRVVTNGRTAWFSVMRRLTRSSTWRSCSAVGASRTAKSKRRRSGRTMDPPCRTCSPSTMRRALCSRCVAVWLQAVWCRRTAFTMALARSPSATLPSTGRATTTWSFSNLTTLSTSSLPASVWIQPVSATCPPPSA